MSLEIGNVLSAEFCSGPPSPNSHSPTQIAIQLSMIVVITSCAPTVALRTPAIPAQRRPPSVAGADREQDVRQRAHPAKLTPSQLATMSPMKYWPWPPMLNMPQRKAKATASPQRISVVVCSSVCERLYAEVSTRFVVGWKNQFRPAPLKMSR